MKNRILLNHSERFDLLNVITRFVYVLKLKGWRLNFCNITLSSRDISSRHSCLNILFDDVINCAP